MSELPARRNFQMPFVDPQAQKLSQISNAAYQALNSRRLSEAEGLFTQVLSIDPQNLKALRGRAISRWLQGKNSGSLADFDQAFHKYPKDEGLLKDYTTALVEIDQETKAVEVCENAIKANPTNITALVGRDWALNKIAPPWHIPMINEKERNGAYFEGLKRAHIGNNDLVFEIGTGSGLLSLMAAELGAEHVVTCEIKKSIANIATKVIAKNHLSEKITVVASSSSSIELGKQLPRKADVLVHEIFSSELLSEGVLPAIEDAKKRLLNEEARVVPSCASAMVALVGGESLTHNYLAGESFGFDLSEFNKTQPRKLPLFREDIEIDLLSKDIAAFSFDFQGKSEFPSEQKEIEIEATKSGLCLGLIQWIRIGFGDGVDFENQPSAPKDISNWQRLIYMFESPIHLKDGDKVTVNAIHDRSRLWFSMAT
jgi:predicted RNA methylase